MTQTPPGISTKLSLSAEILGNSGQKPGGGRSAMGPCTISQASTWVQRQAPTVWASFYRSRRKAKQRFKPKSLRPSGGPSAAILNSLKMPHLGQQDGSAHKAACHTSLVTSSSICRICVKVEAETHSTELSSDLHTHAMTSVLCPQNHNQ